MTTGRSRSSCGTPPTRSEAASRAGCGGRWLYVDELYVDAELRGHGWGSRLLAAAEEEARAAGAIGAYLETFSLQARPFYEAHGYRVVGEVSGFPPGDAYYVLSKPL